MAGEAVGSQVDVASDAVRLGRFDGRYAGVVASWVGRRRELFWLAPRTRRPLTAAKVTDWADDGGLAYLMFGDSQSRPLGYGELNPVRSDPNAYWLGHLVIDPVRRGMGLGRRLTRMLVREAFTIHGAERVVLVVFPDNTAALRCYLGCGFEQRGEEFHRFGRGVRRYRMLRLEMRSTEC